MNDEDGDLSQLFTQACCQIESFALAEIKQETQQKQLYYHTIDHAYAVKRRANIIFQALKPIFLTKIELVELNRIKHLIDICAITHDMVQEFSFSLEQDTSRKRPFGLSETATINKLIDYIRQVNQTLLSTNSQSPLPRNAVTGEHQSIAIFTNADINTIKEAIQATICHYNYLNNFIYQPYLYQSDRELSVTAKIIALADLGTLGMEGIAPYQQEGILLFLEENPDIAQFFSEQKNNRSSQDLILTNLKKSAIYSELKGKLLKYTRSMVKFAQGRKANFEQEISSFNEEAKHILRDRVFIHLTNENIHHIESIVPTKDNTTLTELLEFFNFDLYV